MTRTSTWKERLVTAGIVAACLVIGTSAQAGGPPASGGGGRPAFSLPSRAPGAATSRIPATRPAQQPEKPAKPEQAATATTTVEHTDTGIVRTTTVTNGQGETRSSSTTVSRDPATGTHTVTNSSTGFDGTTRSIENSVTKTEAGTEHTLTRDESDDESDEAAASPPES